MLRSVTRFANAGSTGGEAPLLPLARTARDSGPRPGSATATEPPEPTGKEGGPTGQLSLQLGVRGAEDPVHQWERALVGRVVAILEVLAGRRPQRQLQQLTSTATHRRLAATLARDGPRTTTDRLMSVHSCLAAEGAVELSATLARGRRIQALAARLEQTDRGWVCTEFRVLE